MKTLIKDKNHSHYWIADGILYESYKTIRGLRYRELMSILGMPDKDRLSDDAILEIEKNHLKE